MDKILVTDIETDNLLVDVSKFHCAWTKDRSTGEWKGYRPEDFAQYVYDIEIAASQGYLIAFHNGLGYDLRALRKLKKSILGKNLNLNVKNIFDTLVASRLVYSNVKDKDFPLVRMGKLDGKLIGSHSLKAWGQRLGVLKTSIGDAEEVWDVFTEDMYEYCKQDVTVTDALLDALFADKWYFRDAAHMGASLRLEHDVQWTVTNIINNGYPFNEYKAEKLYQTLLVRRAEMMFTLKETFENWYAPAPSTGDVWLVNSRGENVARYPRVFVPKQGGITLKNGKKDNRDTFEGAPLTRVKLIEFNPASRAHILKVLKENGWEPTEFTEAGNPKLDDEVLETVIVKDPACMKAIGLIREFLMVQKRISQLAEGKQAWLKHVVDGKIHGYINSNGTNTGRATHSFPNIGQVPSVKKEYGKECRELFGAIYHAGWLQVGTDASGLELRCLGHFLAPFDGGEYSHEVVSGDVHTKNQNAAGLPTRDDAKTFIYAFLYGAGDGLIGFIVNGGAPEGKAIKSRFLDGTPTIIQLREAISDTLVESKRYDHNTKKFITKWKRKYLVGLDGRKIHIRSDHSALNALLQSAGALICKAWMVEVERILEEDWGYIQGWDGDFAIMAWVHDELQIACRNEDIAIDITEASKIAMVRVERMFRFRTPLDVESKIGNNWAECH